MKSQKNKLRKLFYNYKPTKKLLKLRKRLYDWKRLAFPILKAKWLHPKTAFLILTPEHNNIGDQAIAYAEKAILKSSNINHFEIPIGYIGELNKNNFLSVFNNRTIYINGGGNLGTIWFDIELLLRQIIINNNKAKIVCLPNSIYYEDNKWGKEELENSKKIYNFHKNLTICAREIYSYNNMKNIYMDIKLLPDVVLTLNFSQEQPDRKGCVLCLRNDIEKTLSNIQIETIKKTATDLFGENISNTDMYFNKPIKEAERFKVINDKINYFKNAELVITDRLHGMIFCAISGTPCIVLNSKSPKVKGCYQWIKHLEYIKFADDIKDIKSLYREIPKKIFYYNDNKKFLDIFKKFFNESN